MYPCTLQQPFKSCYLFQTFPQLQTFGIFGLKGYSKMKKKFRIDLLKGIGKQSYIYDNEITGRVEDPVFPHTFSKYSFFRL